MGRGTTEAAVRPRPRSAGGRTTWLSLQPGVLDQASTWIAETRSHWEGALDRLAAFVEEEP